jgi:hypothetical protein
MIYSYMNCERQTYAVTYILYIRQRTEKRKTGRGAQCNLLALAFQIQDGLYLLSSKMRL